MQKENLQYEFDYSQYKKRIIHKSGFPFSILIILIILLAGIAIYFKPIKTSNLGFYFVKANSFSTYTQANNLSQEIQSLGGAGNLYYNKKYHVIINFYNTEKEAELVCNNLKSNFNNAEVFSISAKNFNNLSNLTQKQNKIVKNLSNFIIFSINELSNLSLQYDKKEISFNQLSSKLNTIFNNYTKHYNDFLSQFKTNNQFNIAREYAKDIYIDLQNLTSKSLENNHSKIKFLIVDIVINFCYFSNCF